MIEIASHESALLGSDFHLSAQDPATARRVLEALQRHGARCDHIFLLGDLFEVWVGDDGADPIAESFASVLQELHRGGSRIWLMCGNRDFLLGHAFAQRCAATLLQDPTPLRLHGRTVVLSHGDALCTDDQIYQQWRKTCRQPAWQEAFLARTLTERQALGRQARDASEAGKRERGDALMDVNADAVEQLMHESNCAWLIHGHTHRPGEHHWIAQGQPMRRTVLPDWDAQLNRGAFLRINAQGSELLA